MAAPYRGSFLEAAHPAHYMCPNEACFQFFDPDYQLWHSCSYKKPLPWKIVKNDPTLGQTLEVVLEPRKDKNGKALKPPARPSQYGAVQLLERKEPESEATMPRRKKRVQRKNKTEGLRQSGSRNRKKV
jgi:hypothetical protein